MRLVHSTRQRLWQRLGPSSPLVRVDQNDGILMDKTTDGGKVERRRGFGRMRVGVNPRQRKLDDVWGSFEKSVPVVASDEG
ncbi:hypothetical protein M0802_012964, partial [Mischocyttarus mexicanus]